MFVETSTGCLALCDISEGHTTSRILREDYKEYDIATFTTCMEAKEAAETIDDLNMLSTYSKTKRKKQLRLDCIECS